MTGIPRNTYVSSLLASRHAAGRVYATFDGHYDDDYRAYAYVTDDYGQSWRSISAGLPDTSVHRLREHPRNARLLFAGHERGIHFSTDAGATWTSLRFNMPTVPVDDLLIHPRDNDLVVGTHGRSIWVLDNIAPLEALTPEVLTRDIFLVPPARARLLSIYNPQAWYGAGQFFAPNPEFGAVLYYYLRDAPDGPRGEVQITIADAEAKPIRTLSAGAQRGLNRIAWDLRLPPPLVEIEPSAAAAGFGGSPSGPLVLPGRYSVTVRTASGAQLNAPLIVEGDSRVAFPDADRRARQTTLLELYALQKRLGDARVAARRSAGEAADRRTADSNRLQTRLAQLQAELSSQLNTATALFRAIEGFSGLPTGDQQRQLRWVSDDASKTISELNRIVPTR